MSIHSFSYRQNERSLRLETAERHKYTLDLGLLRHMFHNMPVYVEMGGLLGIAYMLRTDTHVGLRDDEAKLNYSRRRDLYGTNEYPLPPVRPMLTHIIEAFQDGMLQILILAGVVSIAAGSVQHPKDGWVEGFAILVCVAIVAIVQAYNNHKQEVAYLELASNLKGSDVSVLRGGIEMTLPQDELLVGDLVRLAPGSMIPADGVMVDQCTVTVNESSLTGESDELPKNPKDPFLSSGTELRSGTCSMMLTAVGVNSAKGRIMASLARSQEPTNLQILLAQAEKVAAYIGLVCGVGTFIALLASFFAGSPDYSEEWNRIVEIFIISITVVIVAIPEGLPLAVTVSMAYSMSKMRADQNLVKVLSACETMGNATAICSDKTGTLTQNKMTVVQAFAGSHYFARQPVAKEIDPAVMKLLNESIIMNSDRRVQESNMDFTIQPEDWKWEGDGGATESALLAWLSRYNVPPNQSNIMQLRHENRERVAQFFPFSSAKKFSSVILVEPDPNTPDTLPEKGRQYYKGAADRIIGKCTYMTLPDGSSCRVGDLTGKNENNAGPSAPAPAGRSVTKNSGAVVFHVDGNTNDGQNAPNPNNESFFKEGKMCTDRSGGEACNKWALLGPVTGPNAGQAMYCAEHVPKPSPNIDPEDLDEDIDLNQNSNHLSTQVALIDNHPMRIMDNMARSGLRCIAFAYVDDVKLEIKDGQLQEPAETDAPWTLIGLVGIKDPLRVETKGAVMTVQQAGIVVRMVTGDNIETARFIAKDCCIISNSGHLAMEGEEFRMRLEKNDAYRQLNGEDDPAFLDLVKNLRVMARCQPEDKLELVKFLKEHGEVVGVTGDGSNDGPALKTANVGLAMGIAGTDVAKAAAHIIILDDNFSSIVKSVMWGRSVFDNIRKFLQFQCTVNFCALVVALVGAIGTGKEPLKPIQLLWVNLVMDTMGALAIGTEIPKPTLLTRKAYRSDAPLISKLMWRNIIGQGIVQLAVLMCVLFLAPDWFGGIMKNPDGSTHEGMHFTYVFNVFVWLQLFNEINSRKCNDELNVFVGILDNAWFVTIFIVTCGCQAIMVELLGSFARTTKQPWELWLTAIGFGMVQLVSGFILRLWVPDPTEGQVVVAPETFEGAPWIHDSSLLGAMFQTYRTSDDRAPDEDPSSKEKVVGHVMLQSRFVPLPTNGEVKK